MVLEEDDDITDKDILFRRFFDKMQCEFLKTLVCDEVIEEHKSKPLGQHSEPLERLLLYFRRLPLAGTYAIKRDDASSTFRIVALSGVRGIPPRLVDDRQHTTVEEAYHEVFLKQIDALKGS